MPKPRNANSSKERLPSSIPNSTIHKSTMLTNVRLLLLLARSTGSSTKRLKITYSLGTAVSNASAVLEQIDRVSILRIVDSGSSLYFVSARLAVLLKPVLCF